MIYEVDVNRTYRALPLPGDPSVQLTHDEMRAVRESRIAVYKERWKEGQDIYTGEQRREWGRNA